MATLPFLPGVEYRFATPDDYQSILDIDVDDGAYADGDFLPAQLWDFLHDPLCAPYVGLYQGKVAFFCMSVLIDGGETLLGRAARVDKSCRKLGLNKWGRLIICTKEFMKFEEAKYFVGSTTLWRVSGLDKGRGLFLVRNFCTLKSPNDFQLDLEKTIPTECRPEPLSFNQCEAVLLDKRYNWRLFPSGCLTLGPLSYGLMPANFPRIFKFCHGIFGTKGSEKDPSCYQTLSIGTGFPSNKGYCYDIEVFTFADDPDEVFYHVISHFPIAKRVAKPNLARVKVFFPQKQETGVLLDKIKAACTAGRGSEINVVRTAQYCYFISNNSALQSMADCAIQEMKGKL